MRSSALLPEFVEFVPRELEQGILYVSMRYATTVHLCPCGCGNRVVLPLSPAEWTLHYDGEHISLQPSIGNWEYPCQSHYWITANQIRWARGFTKKEINEVRNKDARSLSDFFEEREIDHPDKENSPTLGVRTLLSHVRRSIHLILKWIHH